MNLKITIGQRRFLIVWILIHSFALFVNIADINGLIINNGPKDGAVEKGTIVNLFTTPQYQKHNFWPFTKFFTTRYNPAYNTDVGNTFYFFGLFQSYDISAFVCYIVLGFGVIYIPKFWKSP